VPVTGFRGFRFLGRPVGRLFMESRSKTQKTTKNGERRNSYQNIAKSIFAVFRRLLGFWTYPWNPTVIVFHGQFQSLGPVWQPRNVGGQSG